MTESINYQLVCKMLLTASEKIRQNHELLSKLDAATGDGDHGTTMLRVVDAIEKTINGYANEDLKAMLYDVGWAIMSADGGSTSPLLGSLLMGMSDAVGDKETLDCSEMVEMFRSGVAKMHKQSKANIGDKTMMDALLPAIEAMKDATNINNALIAAASAAQEGVEATKNMVAKFGRARNLGDRTIGHADAGATSISFIFAGFRDAINS